LAILAKLTKIDYFKPFIKMFRDVEVVLGCQIMEPLFASREHTTSWCSFCCTASWCIFRCTTPWCSFRCTTKTHFYNLINLPALTLSGASETQLSVSGSKGSHHI